MPTLTRPMQIQLLADLLAGQRPERPIWPEEFTQPFRGAWQALQDLTYQDSAAWLYAAIDEVRAALGEHPDADAIIGELLSTDPSGAAHWSAGYPSLAEIAATLPPITWLWPGWLPAGMISLLAARPGAGKSLVALDLARRIIHAEAWPDGAAQSRAGWPILWIEAENVPQILAHRAELWQMDARKLYLALPDDGDLIIDLSTDKYQERVFRMATRIKPGLVVVDSLGSIMPGGENGVEDVRQILSYLNALAAHTAAGLLVIHHLRKANNSGQMALFNGIDQDQIRGSGHIAAVARVAWGLTTVRTTADPDPNGPRKLQVIKTNLSRYPNPLGITLEPIPSPGTPGEGPGMGAKDDGVRLTWSTEAPNGYEEPTSRDAALDWLMQILESEGPLSPREVVELASGEGYSRATIYRARENAGSQIVNTKGRRNPRNLWALPGQDDEEPEL